MVTHRSFLCPHILDIGSNVSTVRLELDEHSTPDASGILTESAEAGLDPNDHAVQNLVNETYSQLMTNAQVYAMAEKFIIPDLKLLAREKFLQRAHGWPIPGLAAIVQEVLTSTPQSDRGLRTIVRDVLSLHVTEIMSILGDKDAEQHSVKTCKTLQWVSILRQDGDFLLEVLGQVTTINAKQINDQHRLDAVRVGNIRHYQDEVKRLERENKALRLGQDEKKRSEHADKAIRLERENQALRLGKENEIRAIRSEKDNEITAIRSEKSNLLKRGGRLVAAIHRYNYCPYCFQVFQPIIVGIGTLDDWADKGILSCKYCRTNHDWT